MNVVLLEGVLSRACEVRELPSGSVLCSLEVTTRDVEGIASTVPVAWFDPPSVPTWEQGTEVVVFGSVRRRWFQTPVARQSRTEVLAELVAPADERRRATKVRDRARRAVTGGAT